MVPHPLAFEVLETFLQISHQVFCDILVQALVVMPRIIVPAVFAPMSAHELLDRLPSR